MGVDIGICKYTPEREERIEKLDILRRLKGEPGKVANRRLDQLYDEMSKEITSSYVGNPAERFKGQRMFNLWYNISTKTVNVEFSFYNLYHSTRVTPSMINDIVADIKKLLPSADEEEREQMEYLLEFFEYLLENNLMIYPN